MFHGYAIAAPYFSQTCSKYLSITDCFVKIERPLRLGLPVVAAMGLLFEERVDLWRPQILDASPRQICCFHGWQIQAEWPFVSQRPGTSLSSAFAENMDSEKPFRAANRTTWNIMEHVEHIIGALDS